MSLIWSYVLENVLTPKECTPWLVCLPSQCQSYFKSCYTLNNRSLYHVRANSQCSQSSQLFTAISWKLAAIFHCDTGTPTVLISVSGKIHHDMISYTYRFWGNFQKRHSIFQHNLHKYNNTQRGKLLWYLILNVWERKTSWHKYKLAYCFLDLQSLKRHGMNSPP